MSGRSDCRKFAPNIFNKSKCTNCFRQKEEHSAEALESNRASRKISKCGYLFVAPGWDFSNPLYRTKRWQRRWFVLYDDGELTYSLDEHPDTVPQASVDMTSVLEVSEADGVTGHAHSLAITSPDRVTFVKGTSREEARWWADILSMYPRSKGRHKRNATFPGGQTGSLLQSSTTRKYSADASTLRDAAEGCGASVPRARCCAGATTWPGPRVQPPQPEIASLAPPPNIDTKGSPNNIHPPPASPILSRTPISRVKEKVRARSCHQPLMRTDFKDEKDEIDSTKDRSINEVDENEKPAEQRKRSYISTIDKQAIEIDDLRKQLKLALSDVNAAESELARLRKLKSEAALREKKMEELVTTLQKKEEELSLRTKEAENLNAIKQLYNQDKTTWETKLSETQQFLKESTEHCELLTRQLTSAQENIKQLQRELNELNEKLLKSVKENENLYARIRDLEGRAGSESPSKEKRKSIGSLSDLTNIKQDLNLDSLERNRLIEEYVELRGRFLKAIQEIKAMKKELREANNMYDELEITNMKLRNEMKLREQCSRSEINLMAAKGEAVPTIQSPSKSGSPAKEKPTKSESITDEKRLKRLAARLRRKSLDSATSSEPMKMLVRLSSLETKISSAIENRRDLTNSCESLSLASTTTGTSVSPENPSLSESQENSIGTQSQRHLLDRLQSLENVVIHSRNKVNECLCQMSAMRAAKSRRSPSPSLEKKYSIKSMEKCLSDVSKRLQECFDKCVVECQDKEEINDNVAEVVVQLEEQLRTKLLEISKKKAALYEAGELTQRKSLELLAEKLAYEAVLIGRIQEALQSSNGSKFFARLIKSEINETSQLIDNLKSKINGENFNNVNNTKSSLDYLARILSRKIDIMNNKETKEFRKSELIIQSADLEALKASQREVAEAVDKYKTEKLAELCSALA
ncbi:PREDICTED: protein outspread-like, partial [Papilio polytes]|uniref:protein outspread-like n=1 Tax=Papilio polytes TaxID=76194 RepID=UPI000676A4BE